jgi:hypothetical protein
MISLLAITFLAGVAPADDSITINKGDNITHAAGNLWRIQHKAGNVKGYIERDPTYPGKARVTDRTGNTIGTIPDDLLDLDSDDSDDPDADDLEN